MDLEIGGRILQTCGFTLLEISVVCVRVVNHLIILLLVSPFSGPIPVCRSYWPQRFSSKNLIIFLWPLYICSPRYYLTLLSRSLCGGPELPSLHQFGLRSRRVVSFLPRVGGGCRCRDGVVTQGEKGRDWEWFRFTIDVSLSKTLYLKHWVKTRDWWSDSRSTEFLQSDVDSCSTYSPLGERIFCLSTK